MELNHIGYVVEDIGKYEKHMLFEKKIKEVFDPLQKSYICLYKNYGSANIELIQPVDQESFTFNFLQKSKSSYHHLCYQVQSVLEMQETASNMKLILIRGPLKAILFDNRNVYFYYSRNKQIIEFLIE